MVLRILSSEISEIAALPNHQKKVSLQKSRNDLKSVRPMVWITEIPWHEMNVNNELTNKTTNPWARELLFLLVDN
jgi:hypothetical protein